MGDTSARFETTGDGLATPTAATWVGKAGLVLAAWAGALGLLITDSHATTFVAAGVAAVAYFVVRSVGVLRPIDVDDEAIRHGFARVSRTGVRVTRSAWTTRAGRIGSVLVVSDGRRTLRIGARGKVAGDEVAAREDTSVPRVHACVRSIEELERIAALLERTDRRAESASPYRDASARASSRTLWASPRLLGWSDSGAFLLLTTVPPAVASVGFNMLRAAYGDAAGGLMVAGFVSAAVAATFHDRYRKRTRGTRCLRVAGESVALEVDGAVTWSVADAQQTGAWLARAGSLAVVALRRVDGGVLRVAAPSAHRGPYEEGAPDVVLSTDDFDWLVSRLGLTATPPKVRMVYDEGEDENDAATTTITMSDARHGRS